MSKEMVSMNNNMKFPVHVATMRLIWPRLTVYYPQVFCLHNLWVQQRINNKIFNLVYKMIVEQGYFENPKTEITGTYEIKTNERGILSLALSNYAFSGGAQGLTILKSLTMDVETGKSYELKDLFKPDSDYVKKLSEIVYEQIKARDIQLIEKFPGIQPDQDYYIADKSLVISYQECEITPCYYGSLYFPISVYEIEDIIDEEGPLGRMIG